MWIECTRLGFGSDGFDVLRALLSEIYIVYVYIERGGMCSFMLITGSITSTYAPANHQIDHNWVVCVSRCAYACCIHVAHQSHSMNTTPSTSAEMYIAHKTHRTEPTEFTLNARRAIIMIIVIVTVCSQPFTRSPGVCLPLCISEWCAPHKSSYEYSTVLRRASKCV